MATSILLLAVLVVAIVVFAKGKTTARSTKAEQWPLVAKRPLQKGEQVVYFHLRLALPEQVILAQVALPAFIQHKGNGSLRYRRHYDRLIADFVVCDKSFRVLAVIEVDGTSHDSPTQHERDRRKEKAVTTAGLKFLRWNSRNLPSKEEMRAQILDPMPQDAALAGLREPKPGPGE